MSRRTREERRTDYLDLGVALVAESAVDRRADPGLALTHVKLADVAARAGVTKGALYHIWPSQESFWNDLLRYLLDSRQLFATDLVVGAAGEAPTVGPTGPTFREFCNQLFDAVRDDPIMTARISLFSYLDDETVRADMDASFRHTLQQAMPVLAGTLDRAGRQLLEGVSLQDLAVALGALLEGLCLQYRIGAERTPEVPHPDGQRWTLYAVAAEALMVGYTEPVAAMSGSGAR